jgi:two-component system, OmpR family, phosphate regulon sensor histidine kinase PhoR
MNLTSLAIGFSVGISFYLWQQYRLNRQLKKMLDSESQDTSLSALFLVRRELSLLHDRIEILSRELQNWRDLLELAPVGYLRVDGDDRLIWCNRQARKLLRIDRWQEGQIRLLLELVRSLELDRWIETTRQTQQPQTWEWTYNYTNYQSRGNTETIALTGYSLPLNDGYVDLIIENRQPLLDLKQANDRAISDVIHELRTPLTAISLVAETLESRIAESDRIWLGRMRGEIDRLIAIVCDWLDLIELQANPQKYLHYDSIDFQELIAATWQILEPLSTPKDVSLDYNPHPHPDFVGDRDRLTQVFLNLFDNALKHSPPHSKIAVTVTASPTHLNIDIVDAGTGFLPEDLPHIFERLYRSDKSRTKDKNTRGGSGLGLAIAKAIIIACGGSIEANNHPQGGGWLQVIFPFDRNSNQP